jgi:uncharacterized protein YxeA
MWLKRILPPLVTVLLLAGAGFAAFRTQDKWVPYVFPTKSEAKADTTTTRPVAGTRGTTTGTEATG